MRETALDGVKVVEICNLVARPYCTRMLADMGAEVIKQLNPRLIMTSITPFGQTGPYKDYKAYPINSIHGN